MNHCPEILHSIRVRFNITQRHNSIVVAIRTALILFYGGSVCDKKNSTGPPHFRFQLNSIVQLSVQRCMQVFYNIVAALKPPCCRLCCRPLDVFFPSSASRCSLFGVRDYARETLLPTCKCRRRELIMLHQNRTQAPAVAPNEPMMLTFEMIDGFID